MEKKKEKEKKNQTTFASKIEPWVWTIVRILRQTYCAGVCGH
jgi:hypothetical protein